jgi:uncharacterized membrane protein
MAVALEVLGQVEEVVDSVAAGVVLVAVAHREDGSMNISRIIKHLLYPPWFVRFKFPPASLHKIEASIQQSEAQHSGEIRFAVESSLGFFQLLQGTPCIDRGIDVFSELRIWDTDQNNGVLIFLLLADRKVEIIADRGLNNEIAESEWRHICQQMENSFRKHEFETGIIDGITEITQLLIKHSPIQEKKSNELSNKPVII